MGYMIFPGAEKAVNRLYHVAKSGGKCYITSWKEVGHKHVGMRVIKHLREEGNYNVPLIFWEDEMTDVEYLVTDLQKVGFKDCAGETLLRYMCVQEKRG